MANHTSLSVGQAEALHKFLAPRLTSVDDLIKEVGQEEAFRLFTIKERLAEKFENKNGE